jgi:hypothetical protein
MECPFCQKGRGRPPFVCGVCRTAIPAGAEAPGRTYRMPAAEGRAPAIDPDDPRPVDYRHPKLRAARSSASRRQ